MQKIQNALLECIEVCLQELKRSNPTLDMEDWTPDAALHRNFDVTVRRLLDPIWHRVSWKTRTIVNDLSLLRRILHYLLTYDAVGFHEFLETVLSSNTPAPGSSRQNHSPWLFLDAAHTVFATAKERVYAKEGMKREGTAMEDSQETNMEDVTNGMDVVLEELPKWETLKDTLEEIENEIVLNPVNDDGTNAVVVMCTDERTCKQLREYLQLGGDTVMKRRLQEYFTWKANFQKSKTQLFEKKSESVTEGIYSYLTYADPRCG
jgi:DNA excision repair protein ERCC-4